MPRVMMVTHYTDGDVLPFVRLGQVLAGRGHDVTLLGPEPYAPAAGGQVRYVAVTSTEAYQRELAASPQVISGAGPTAITEFFRRYGFVDAMRREVAALLAGAGTDTVLVGRHTSALSVLIAAEASGAPAAWVAVTPFQYLTAPVALANLGPVLRTDVAEVRAGLGLAPVPDWTAWFTGAPDHPGVHHIGLWPEWFDRAGQPAPAPVRLTGFVPPDSVHPEGMATPAPLPAETAALLAGEPAAVLVTGGTGRMLEEGFYRVAVAGARALGRPVLVVTRHRDLLPAGPAATGTGAVHWQPWLPFGAVLPRVAAVVHHGGIGTLARAVACGAPQLVLGFGFDRADNGERIERLGLGSYLPRSRWSPSRVAEALAALVAAGAPAGVPGLAPDRWNGSLDGTAAAADAIEAVARRGQPPRPGGGGRRAGTAPPPEPAPAARPATVADQVRALPPERREALTRLRAGQAAARKRR